MLPSREERASGVANAVSRGVEGVSSLASRRDLIALRVTPAFPEKSPGSLSEVIGSRPRPGGHQWNTTGAGYFTGL